MIQEESLRRILLLNLDNYSLILLLPLERLPKFAMFDKLLIKHGFGKCLSTSPTKPSQKIHWLDDRKSHVHQLIYNFFDTIIIGDSIAVGLSRYSNVWEIFFKESLNLDIGVDRTQHLLWRMERLPVPSHLKYVIIYCGTNSISKDSPSEVANSILCIALLLKKRNPCLKIIITWIFPRVYKFSRFHIIVPQINQLLKIFASTYDFIDYREPTKLVPVSSVVCKSFIFSQRVCEVDPSCYVTGDVSTVKNGKYSPSCYNVTSVTHVKVCNFFSSCQMVCEVIPSHVDVVHVTTNVTVKH